MKYIFIIFLVLILSLKYNRVSGQNLDKNSSNTDSLYIVQLQNIATELFDNGNISALDSVKKAIDFSENIDYKYGIVSSYILLGQFQQTLGKYDLALKTFLFASNFCENNNLKKELALTFDEIGSNYYLQEDFNNALPYYFKALEINSEISNNSWISVNYNNIGLSYIALEDKTKGLEYLKKAVNINSKGNNEFSLANNYGGIALFFEEEEQFDSALYYYNLRLDIYSKNQNMEGICNTYWLIGDCYLKINKDSAFYYISTSKQLADSLEYTEILQSTSEKLSELYAEKYDFYLAYKYLKTFNEISDSIEDLSMKQEISNVKMEYKYTIREQETFFKNQKRKILILFIISLLALLNITIVLIFNRQRIKLKSKIIQNEKLELEKKILAQNIEYKNKEITSNLILQAKKNEQIKDILQKLDSHKQKTENDIVINETVKDLTKIQDNKIWKDFEISFKQVHNSFYDNLFKEFPDLSRNEKRLCAFLRLNMNTKDISEITNQSIKSINVARTRLRRKLNLDNSDISLTQFLSKF